jgi:hypothetical protein
MTVQASDANTEKVFSKGFAETSWNGTSLQTGQARPSTHLDGFRVYRDLTRHLHAKSYGLLKKGLATFVRRS